MAIRWLVRTFRVELSHWVVVETLRSRIRAVAPWLRQLEIGVYPIWDPITPRGFTWPSGHGRRVPVRQRSYRCKEKTLLVRTCTHWQARALTFVSDSDGNDIAVYSCFNDKHIRSCFAPQNTIQLLLRRNIYKLHNIIIELLIVWLFSYI